jgi:cell division transport system permease protein
MSIFSRREEIKMMKLVGADRHFIRGPFLVEARICGMISGFIAGTAGYVAMLFMTPKRTEYGIDVSVITSIIKSEWIIAVYAALIALGMIIGTFSAKLAIRK